MFLLVFYIPSTMQWPLFTFFKKAWDSRISNMTFLCVMNHLNDQHPNHHLQHQVFIDSQSRINKVFNSYLQSPKVWSNFPPYKIIKQATICQLSLKTLPEAQRTQGIESLTQIITHGKNYSRGEMKYMSDYKNQAWSLKLEKSSVRTISLCPLLGDHHLNDNHQLPNGPTTYIVANMITAPTFPATLSPTCRPPW